MMNKGNLGGSLGKQNTRDEWKNILMKTQGILGVDQAKKWNKEN